MITEDYCSKKVSELLKEKRFNEPCYRWYDTKGDVCAKFINPDIPLDYSSREYYLCPSQSMAMKWLREVHRIFICIEFDVPTFAADMYKMDETDEYGCAKYISPTIANCKTYEEAVEAALKYCLENLI